MNIRIANKFDQPHIFKMLRNFRDQSPIQVMSTVNNEEYVSKLLNALLHGRGVILIAEKEEPVGMLMAVIDQNVWDPNVFLMKELVYWVEPEHRGSTAGYRLLAKYNELAKKMVDDGKISFYTMSKLTKSPDLDYGRFGYERVEETWVAGV